jgi:hypothetical protein
MIELRWLRVKATDGWNRPNAFLTSGGFARVLQYRTTTGEAIKYVRPGAWEVNSGVIDVLWSEWTDVPEVED